MENIVSFDLFKQNAQSVVQMYYFGNAGMEVKFFLIIPHMEN